MKRRVRFISLLPLLTMAFLCVFLLSSLTASAASVGKAHLMGTKQNSHPHPNNLQYNGGPVMRGASHDYAIFWVPSGSYISPHYITLLSRYFGDVGGSKLYHNNTQYPDSTHQAPTSSSLAGAWTDTRAYPGNPIFDSDLQNEVSHAMSVNGWSASIDNIFFVFTAKGENSCFDQSQSQCSFTTYCAYHSYFGSQTIYANMPYTGTSLSGCGVPSSPNHDFDSDSTINVTSHEQMEAATDPLLNAWIDPSGQEIGDLCAWNFGKLNSYGGDVLWNNHPYMVQKEWDNHRSGCRLGGP